MCWSLFVIKLQACNFIKKRLQHRRFSMKFVKFLTTPILRNIAERLLLKIISYLSLYNYEHLGTNSFKKYPS